MRKRLFGRFFLFLIVLVIGLCALTACVEDKPPEKPEDKTNEYLGNLGGIVANTLAMNPEEGFLMDLAANAAWKFAKEEKSQYDWSYGLTVKANVFADGETKQGIAIELRDTLSGVDNSEPTLGGGGGLLFGLYNTPNEDLYVAVGEDTKYHFNNVAVSTALKALLKSNGIDLNFNLKDVEVGGLGGLGALVSSSLPLLVLVTDVVEQNGNDFTIELKFSKIYELLKTFVDLSTLPEAVTKLLPKEMSVKAVLHTDGKILTGIDVVDTVMTTNDGAGDGTFNLRSKFNLFGAPAKSLDIAAMVPAELKAVEARKILNVDTHGDILFEKTEKADPAVEGSTDTVVTTRTISWKLAANFDLFKAMERNFILEDEIFDDNFLHFQLKLDGEPVLDLAFSPKTFQTNDLELVANIKILLDLVSPESGIGTMLSGMLLPDNLIVPINTKALGYMISGESGKIEIPTPQQSWANPAKYEALSAEEEEETTDFLGTIKKFLGFVTVAEDGLEVRVSELFTALGLDEGVTSIIGNFTGGGETARFTNNVFGFAKAETEAYDLDAELRKGKEGDRDFGFADTDILSPVRVELVTDEGFLKVINQHSQGEDVACDRSTRVTAEQLNAFIGNTQFYISWIGYDMDGTLMDMDSGALSRFTVSGYRGLDPTKIGVQQTIEVLTGIPDVTGIFGMLPMLGGSGMFGDFDLNPVIDLLMSLKLQAFSVDVILSEAEYDVAVYNVKTGKDLDENAVYTMETYGSPSDYGIRIKETYFANAAYPEAVSKESKVDQSDWLQMEGVIQNFYLEYEPFETVYLSGGAKRIFTEEESLTFNIVYKGVKIEKTYRFEPPKNVKVNVTSSFTVGETVRLYLMNKYFTITGEYKNSVLEFNSRDYSAANFEFVNAVELTGKTYAEITESGSFVPTASGVAVINVKLCGKVIGTLNIPVNAKT